MKFLTHKLTFSVFGLALLVTITTTGCDSDYRAAAVGQNTAITVVADSTLWRGPIGDAIRDQLGYMLETLPQGEPAFDLFHVNLHNQQIMEQVKRQKNVVFVAPLNDTTSNVGRMVRAWMDPQVVEAIQSGQRGIFRRPDLWYRDQMVMFMTAATPEALVNQIQADGANLRYTFNVLARQRMTGEMFQRARQSDMEEQLMDAHDFAVNVQHDYIIARDTTGFVRLRRILSDTWREFFVYYIDNANPGLITPEWIMDTRDSLSEKYIRGTFDGSYVRIDRRRPFYSENINFTDRYAYETRGLWHMTGDAMGGPFLNYTFYDEEQRRIYMLDGMVFAPNYGKREFLRQIEAIFHTFRTQQDTERSEQLTALQTR